MKLSIYASLLVLSAVCAVPAFAQTADVQRDVATAKRDATDAKRDAADAKRDAAEEARTRAKLEEARVRLDKAAREVAELSGELGANARRDIRIRTIGGQPRVVLGVLVDSEKGKDGVRVRSVSPGGPAEEAGILKDDLIVSLDGVSVIEKSLNGQMQKVKPEQKVKVRVLRAGKQKDLIVIARPLPGHDVFTFSGPEFAESTIVGGRTGIAMPEMGQVRRFQFFGNEFSGLELASITPKLGAYFGATDGVLVVSAPEGDSFKLEDGDVIQSIDGRKPEDGGHALRILRSYKSGEKLNLTVLRQKKPLTLAVTMPERQVIEEHFMGPPMPAVPLPPPAPPGAKGSFD